MTDPLRKILYSPGFGAGWTTWNSGDIAKYMLTYQPIIDFLEAGNTFTDADCHNGFGEKKHPIHPLLQQLQRECAEKFGVEHVCVLGADDLKVATVNGRVLIEEYDGSESYREESSDEGWMTMTDPLRELRAKIVDFQTGTQPRSKRPGEIREVEAMQGVFRVVLHEIDALLALAVVPPPAPEGPQGRRSCETCVSWKRREDDGETGVCQSTTAHWHGAGFNTFGQWYCRDWQPLPAAPPRPEATKDTE